MKAKVAHFYGWTDRDIITMPFKKFMEYWNCISAIEAQNALMDLQVVSYPNMKKSDRSKLFNNLKKTSQAVIRQSGNKVLTTQEMAAQLARTLKSGN